VGAVVAVKVGDGAVMGTAELAPLKTARNSTTSVPWDVDIML